MRAPLLKFCYLMAIFIVSSVNLPPFLHLLHEYSSPKLAAHKFVTDKTVIRKKLVFKKVFINLLHDGLVRLSAK